MSNVSNPVFQNGVSVATAGGVLHEDTAYSHHETVVQTYVRKSFSLFDAAIFLYSSEVHQQSTWNILRNQLYRSEQPASVIDLMSMTCGIPLPLPVLAIKVRGLSNRHQSDNRQSLCFLPV